MKNSQNSDGAASSNVRDLGSAPIRDPAPLIGNGLVAGEQRIVSILFADVVGSTHAIRDMAPERAGEFLDHAIDRIKGSVHEFGGAILKIQGDGVMAVFGALVCYEDHAARAAKAALNIQRSFERQTNSSWNANVRIGVHTGPVLIRWQQSDFGWTLDTIGVAVHLAAKLEQHCHPKSVFVSRQTLSLLPGRNDATFVKQIECGGSDERLEAFELLNLAENISISQLFRGKVVNPLVGREQSRQKIERLIRSVRYGAGGSVGVIGEAGMGKSRLLYEAMLDSVRMNISYNEICGLAINQNVPFRALSALIRELITKDTSTDRDHVSRILKGMGLSPLEILAILEILDMGALKDQKWRNLSPDERNRLICEASAKIVTAKSSSISRLIIVDDVHFLDNETKKFLRILCEISRYTRLGVLMAGRPESSGLIEERCVDIVRLQPLTAAESIAMVKSGCNRQCAVSEAKLDGFAEEVALRAAGLPLAIEEFTNHLMKDSRNIKSFDFMPTKLDGIFRAKLETLSSGAKALAQLCSVIGDEIKTSLLQESARSIECDFAENFAVLLQHRIIEASDVNSVKFSHQLLQEVCYNGLVRVRRSELHAAVLGVLQKQNAASAAVAQELARHAYGAGYADDALRYLFKACEQAIDKAAIETVYELYRQAGAICREIGQEADAHAAKFSMLAFDAAQQLARQEDLKAGILNARELNRAINDDRGATLATIHLSMIDWIAGRHEDALDNARRACRHTDDDQGSPLSIYAQFTLGNVEFATGNPRGAVGRLRRLIERLSGDMQSAKFGMMISVPGVMARAFASWYMTDIGATDEARAASNSVYKISEQLDHAYSRLLFNLSRGYIAYRTGEIDDAAVIFSEAHQTCLSRSFFGLEPMASAWYASALIAQGKLQRAQIVLDKSAQLGFDSVVRNSCLYYLTESRARLIFALGEHEKAISLLENAIQRSSEQSDLVHVVWGQALKNEFAEKAFGWGEPLAADVRNCMATARRLGLSPVQTACKRTLELYDDH